MAWGSFRFTFVAAALLVGEWALGQAVIVDLIENGESVTETANVRLERFADFQPAPKVSLNMQLDDGDLLSNAGSRTMVELECPAGSNTTFKLTGQFRVIIAGPETNDCHLDLMSGRLDVLADTSTQVNSGGVVLGTEGTQYSLSLSRTEDGPVRAVEVYEGRVRVDGVGEPVRLKALEALFVRPETSSARTVKASDRALRKTAALYSRFDVSKAIRRGTAKEKAPEAARQFSKLHYEVLTQPTNPESRVNLAKTQTDYKLNNAAVYNLRKAKVVTQGDFDRYKIDATKLKEGLNQKNGAYIQSKLPQISVTPGSKGTIGGAYVSPYALTGSSQQVTDYSLQLISKGDYKTAIAELKKKLETGKATSRDYYALSQAYAELNDGKRSAEFAERAKKMSQTDRELSQRELSTITRTP